MRTLNTIEQSLLNDCKNIKPKLLLAKVRTIDSPATGLSVRHARVSKGIKQAALAKRLNISNAHLCYLEAGTRLWTPKMIARVDAALEQP